MHSACYYFFIENCATGIMGASTSWVTILCLVFVHLTPKESWKT